MTITLISIEVILTLLLLVIAKRFVANKPAIEILFQKLIFLNKELENAERISTERLNQQSFEANGMRWSKFKLPFILINKKKFTCNTYKTAARDYSAYLRPVIVVALIWLINLILIAWKII